MQATSYLLFKAAYELATRLPRADEVFGDGGRVNANLSLKPEHSHNTNLSAVLHDLKTAAGLFGLEAHLFDRRASQLITLLGSRDFATYRNISSAHARGVEALGSWKSPGNYLQLDANATYISMRNESKNGEFESFKGDRIPNRPYLFSNGNARLSLPRVVNDRGEVLLGYNLRYVHWFWRSWESGGTAGPKQRIPSQLSHALSLTYMIKVRQKAYSWSMEVQNLGDARIYDNFGTQRPGRAFYTKINAEF